MRTLAILAASLTLAFSTLADAKPRKHARRAKAPTSAATEAYIAECVGERTGPDGGIPVKEALKLCTGIVRHDAKITKLAARAAKAIEACEEEVSIACEDTTERDHDGGECSDATLRAAHAFDVCTGHGPAFVAEGK